MESSFLKESLYFNLRLLITTIICAIIIYYGSEIIIDYDTFEILSGVTVLVYMCCLGIYNRRIEDYIVGRLAEVYKANNIILLENQTDSFIDKDLIKGLPYYHEKSKRKKIRAKKMLTTKLDDLNLMINVDKIVLEEHFSAADGKKYIHILEGYGFVVETGISVKNDEKIIYSRSHLYHDVDPQFVITMADGSIIYSNSQIDEKIIDFFNSPIFKPESKYDDVIAVLDGNKLYLIIENIVERPMYIRLFWTSEKIQKKYAIEKRTIYLYNQKIIELSRAIEKLKTLSN